MTAWTLSPTFWTIWIGILNQDKRKNLKESLEKWAPLSSSHKRANRRVSSKQEKAVFTRTSLSPQGTCGSVDFSCSTLMVEEWTCSNSWDWRASNGKPSETITDDVTMSHCPQVSILDLPAQSHLASPTWDFSSAYVSVLDSSGQLQRVNSLKLWRLK